ncbi:transposase [Falsiroseomonas oryzae]|uniref:transposase n=1 Tax=Falsiroseomonas oryzae TaxID=2766473 RepID=UPI0022EABDDA|nr:transposase [Roseomonas sp. MO-31]
MRSPPPAFPPHRFARHAWAPMTDAEWALLGPLVTRALEPGPGRPPQDPRRLWDAIFWVACSTGPWRELPAHLGKADTAHRTLRRHVRSGLLDRLLLAISPHPINGGLFAGLAWRIARAWRRMARRMTMGQLLMAKRLGLLSALPCDPGWLPKPHLSEGLT